MQIVHKLLTRCSVVRSQCRCKLGGKGEEFVESCNVWDVWEVTMFKVWSAVYFVILPFVGT